MTFDSPPLSLNSTFNSSMELFKKRSIKSFILYFLLSLLTGFCFIKNISAIFLFVMDTWEEGWWGASRVVANTFRETKDGKNIFEFVCSFPCVFFRDNLFTYRKLNIKYTSTALVHFTKEVSDLQACRYRAGVLYTYGNI